MENNQKDGELMEALEMEKLNLEANTVLRNESECMRIKHRIADIMIARLVLSGDLPLTALITKPLQP